MRECGECQLCCKLFPVPVLDKPAGAWCRHSCAGGCAIHGPKQPEICRTYDCYWRDHDDVPDACRPDRIGVVVTESGNVMVGSHFLPVVTVQEDFEDAARGTPAARMLEGFVRDGFSVLVIHGLESRVEFDRARYADVSDEMIEAALRYELSQDADELHRLGAVDDSFHKLSVEEALAACRNEPERTKESPRFQYSLRTLLIVMTASAAIMGIPKSLGMLPPLYFMLATIYLVTCVILSIVSLLVMLFISLVARICHRLARLDHHSLEEDAPLASEIPAESLADSNRPGSLEN
jgi:hypothetical protein